MCRQLKLFISIALISMIAPVGAAHAGWRISLGGYGPAKWGMSMSHVARLLHVSFDCSHGAVPGMWLCPSSTPELPVTLGFSDGAFDVVFTYRPGARTTRGVHVGTSRATAQRRYGGAPYKRNVQGTSSNSSYVLARSRTHAMTFEINPVTDRVFGISAFRSASTVGAEICA